MPKRDWLTAVPLGLIYIISFFLVKHGGLVGIYFWAGGLAAWIVVANVLRTPNTLPEENPIYLEAEDLQIQEEPESQAVLSM